MLMPRWSVVDSDPHPFSFHHHHCLSEPGKSQPDATEDKKDHDGHTDEDDCDNKVTDEDDCDSNNKDTDKDHEGKGEDHENNG
ncbi:LOW QUALITY PROTEIN: hypothetical protein CVT25_006276 [Psilocybe cyanescens]|uniref:Uncharacterized protein n=1 Tax=Psilocybe cyanescens TaxID=93625 RepID=A0A409X3Y7_PSICY|nr:LOW QUALITY PROTEIN: hypothetical protein CVT25_006276 [Psilocybe cyanescens]